MKTYENFIKQTGLENKPFDVDDIVYYRDNKNRLNKFKVKGLHDTEMYGLCIDVIDLERYKGKIHVNMTATIFKKSTPELELEYDTQKYNL